MSLSKRIKMILKENNLRQNKFSAEIGVTESYISAIINGRNTKVSPTLANLIEEKYGYNSDWILYGTEPKLKSVGKNKNLSDLHKRTIFLIEQLSPKQIKAVLAFVNALDEIENSLKE